MKIFNAFQLKMIALLTMMIDHFGIVFFPQMEIFRIIGRIAFILFAFLLTEGAVHTKDFKGYLKRLLIWAFLSEIPYDLAVNGKLIDWQSQNIFFSLLLSAFGLYQFKVAQTMIKKISTVIATFFVADLLKVDYGVYGLAVVYSFYLIKSIDIKLIVIQVLSSLATFLGYFFQAWSGLAFIPILLYNGKQGIKTGRVFYSFYAAHLLLFSVIKILLKQ